MRRRRAAGKTCHRQVEGPPGIDKGHRQIAQLNRDVEGEAGIEGNEVFFASIVSPANESLELVTDSETGDSTLTPSDGIAGVYGVLVGVRALIGAEWDTQEVPVFIRPAAPGEVELLDGSDTGTLDDGITSRNNTQTATLSFRIHDVIAGAEVTLYADGVAIGQTIASGDSTVIVADGDFDGAIQMIKKKLQ